MRFKYRTDVFNHIQGRQQRERKINKQTNKKVFGQKTTDRNKETEARMIQRRVSLAVDLYEGTRTTRGEIVTDKRGEWGKKSQKSKMDDRERKRFSLFGV